MPLDFPDMASLKRRAKIRGFRQPTENETEDEYRSAFSHFMLGIDRVESAEISSGKGWDKMDPAELLLQQFL